MGTPTNVRVDEVKQFDITIMIGDTLDAKAIGPDDVVNLILQSDVGNTARIRLNYTQLMRLTTGKAQGYR